MNKFENAFRAALIAPFALAGCNAPTQAEQNLASMYVELNQLEHELDTCMDRQTGNALSDPSCSGETRRYYDHSFAVTRFEESHPEAVDAARVIAEEHIQESN